MAPVLLACGTCFDGFQLAPLQRALDAAGIANELALFGHEHEVEAAGELGVRVDRRCDPDGDAQRETRLAADLVRRPWRCVATLGTGSFAMTLGAAAWEAGLAVVRLDAGVHVHPEGAASNRRGRGTIPFATSWCVAGDWERRELLREQRPAADVHVTGSLLARALADLPPGGGEPRGVWLALEHREHVDSRAGVEVLLLQLAALPTVVRGAAGRLGPRLEALGIALPANVELPETSARAQLDAARQALVVVTDSVGWQRLSAAAGIPCAVLPGSEVWPAGIAAGLVTAADDANPLEQCVSRMLARGRSAPAPAGDPAGAVLAVLAKITSPPVAPASAPAGVPADAVSAEQAKAASHTLASASVPAGDAAGAVLAMPATVTSPPVAFASAPPPALPSDGDASGRTLGEDEIALVAEVIRRGTLNSTRGTMVTAFEQRFAQWLGTRHAIACASGSAAMHCAIAALRLQPGDEVVTTPITDMGALTPIVYEGGVPVFADVDPVTMNVTPATVAARLTGRTRAIVATHLFGLPCDLDGLRALANDRGVALIEDAAQAFGATWRGAKVGTHGRIAAFSLQQGKHITTGEGGIVATDDDELARRVFLFVNKAWGYGDPQPDHYFPALNYRLTELQGAVALAQLPKLDGVVAARRAVAAALCERLAGMPGLVLPADPAHGTHSWWKVAFHVDDAVVPGGAVALGKRMQRAGVACVPRYVQKPAFECELFRDWRRSPVTWLPLQHNPRREGAAAMFDRADFPGAVRALERVIVLPINERYTTGHVEHVAHTIGSAMRELRHG